MGVDDNAYIDDHVVVVKWATRWDDHRGPSGMLSALELNEQRARSR